MQSSTHTIRDVALLLFIAEQLPSRLVAEIHSLTLLLEVNTDQRYCTSTREEQVVFYKSDDE
jgi:hypothetical protein